MTDEQKDILTRAAAALAEQNRLRDAIRRNDTELRALCRAYDKHFGLWGCAPHHLRIAAENHGLLDKAV